jgi:hypothetical protein
MNVVWLFWLLVMVVVGVAACAWMDHWDAHVLRSYLRRKYPIRLTNSFWGALEPGDRNPGQEAPDDPGRAERDVQKQARRQGRSPRAR